MKIENIIYNNKGNYKKTFKPCDLKRHKNFGKKEKGFKILFFVIEKKKQNI